MNIYSNLLITSLLGLISALSYLAYIYFSWRLDNVSIKEFISPFIKKVHTRFLRTMAFGSLAMALSYGACTIVSLVFTFLSLVGA